MIKRTSAPKTASTRVAKTAPIASTSETLPTQPTPQKGNGYARTIPLAVLLVVLVGGAGYFVNAAMKSRSAGDISNIQVREGVDPKEVASVIDRVRELVAVSRDEMPTVATVQDISVLRPQNPTLYRDAQNGDKLLVWSDKVVVFSTSMDRVLVAMPINIGPETSQTAPSDARVAAASATEEEPRVTIEVRNGTPTPGVARTLSEELKKEGFQTLAPGDANNKTYTSTVIYNTTGKAVPKTLEKLVAATGGTVVTALPGEGTSKADLLIIVGGKQ
jgi:hypothetical protein